MIGMYENTPKADIKKHYIKKYAAKVSEEDIDGYLEDIEKLKMKESCLRLIITTVSR